MAQLTVDLVAAASTVWSGAAKSISAPAHDGQIGVLPGHVPVLCLLQSGVVSIEPEGGGEAIQVRTDSGFLSVDSDQVTIVVENAEKVA